jgi:hypothetical protein
VKDASEGRGVPRVKQPDEATRPVQPQEAVHQALGQVVSQQGLELGLRAIGLPPGEGFAQAQMRQQVDRDRGRPGLQ